LWIIEAFPKLTSVQLSEISFWSPSTANVVVRNLYTKGLILKEKSSFKNSLYLYLSHEGEELIIDEFRENLKKLSIFNISDKIKSNELEKAIMLLRRMNAILMNNNTETYIERTFNIIQKRI
jgi:predicted transcriptional regulator